LSLDPAVSRSSSKQLTEEDVRQRVLRVDSIVALFPDQGVHFDLWHEGIPWASRVRREPCLCSQQPELHAHFYLEGGEIHAGLCWEIGSILHFELDDKDQLRVSGDLRA